MPSPDALLEARLRRGWRPVPSALQSGYRILGHAASMCAARGDGTVRCRGFAADEEG
ncbi:MAG: hypothetical protein AAFZ18_07970 [Myxococcota bacterium]